MRPFRLYLNKNVKSFRVYNDEKIKDSKPSLWRIVVFSLLLVTSIILAIGESVRAARLAIWGIQAKATVTDVRHGGRGVTVSIRFTDQNGISHDISPFIHYSGDYVHIPGAVFPIVYLPSDPNIVAAKGLGGYGFILIVFALVILCSIVFIGNVVVFCTGFRSDKLTGN